MSVIKMGAKKLTPEFVKKFLQHCKGYDKGLNMVNFVKAENGVCLAELKVEEQHLNAINTMHGGFVATLIDSITSYAMSTNEKCPPLPNVSVGLNITYFKEAYPGDEIVIDAKTLKFGKSMVFLGCDVRNKATGELLAQGTHTKYIIQKEKEA